MRAQVRREAFDDMRRFLEEVQQKAGDVGDAAMAQVAARHSAGADDDAVDGNVPALLNRQQQQQQQLQSQSQKGEEEEEEKGKGEEGEEGEAQGKVDAVDQRGEGGVSDKKKPSASSITGAASQLSSERRLAWQH